MSAVAIIPARGGSRRIPRKNIKLFHGKPIIAYSIEAAKASGLFDVVVVSSEDNEIGEVALQYGAIWTPRSEEMSRDEVGTQEVMRNVLQTWSEAGYDYACCIYPCAPMMTEEDLQRAAAWVDLSGGRGYAHIPGWFYYARTMMFLDGIPVEESAPMTAPGERYIDINTPYDWAKAEGMYAALHKEKT